MDVSTAAITWVLISMLPYGLCMTDPLDDLTININVDDEPKGIRGESLSRSLPMGSKFSEIKSPMESSDLSDDYTFKEGHTCPTDFIEDFGNINTDGLGKIPEVSKIEDCGEECIRNNACNSFSYNPTKLECTIFEQIHYTHRKIEKSTFCRKKTVLGEDCNRDCNKYPLNWTCEFTLILERLTTVSANDSKIRRADGYNRSVVVFNGQLPGPTIAVCQGDNIIINLINMLVNESSTIHFHGIRQKAKVFKDSTSNGGSWSDGVPHVTQCPTPPQENFTYIIMGSGGVDADYNNAPAGTYWYHSHVGRQRIDGAGGKLIIMPREKNEDGKYDIDKPIYSLIIQEWYNNINDPLITGEFKGLLVNGKGKPCKKIFKCAFPEDPVECIKQYRRGEKVTFAARDNEDFENQINYQKENNFESLGETISDYEKFTITELGAKYRFRIIGAMGENFPIRISIEKHNFSVISVDSVDIKPIHDLTALWLAVGERYDIVINTKTEDIQEDPYKILVYTNKQTNKVEVQNGTKKELEICTLAWLVYPNQTVRDPYFAAESCDEIAIPDEKFKKELNPVPDKDKFRPKINSTQYIFPHQLRARVQAKDISSSMNTRYITMPDSNFNEIRNEFPVDTPYLVRPPSNNATACGTLCKGLDVKGNLTTDCKKQNLPKEGNGTITCQHFIQQPSQPPNADRLYWFELVISNIGPVEIAHPIHVHGGWFNIVGMGQFNDSVIAELTNSSQTNLEKMDKDCDTGCLPRNLEFPVFKDTVQVPKNGYVILRIPIDNPGMHNVHCHIDAHYNDGMAFVMQLGEPGEWKMGPNEEAENRNKNNKCQCKYDPGEKERIRCD